MLVNVGFRVLDGNGPLLVPPIGHGEYAAVDHAEPELPPDVDVDVEPVAIVANFLRIEHQRAVDASAGDIADDAVFPDDVAVAVGEFFAELAHVGVVFARKDMPEGGQAGGHGVAVGVVSAAVEDLVLVNQVHHLPAGAKRCQGNAATDGFGQRDHVWLHAEILAGAAPAELRAGFHFIKDEQRAVFGADVTQALEETGLRHAQAEVHEDGFENDRRDLPGQLFEAIFNTGEIVEGGNADVVENRFDHAETAGNGIGRVNVAGIFDFGLDTDKRGVVQAVVGPLEAQDFVAAS